MLAEAVNCTHNGTGGSGTLTLTSVTGYPQITDVFGASGTLNVNYTIAEYTDSTLVTLSKYESGFGSIVLSTNVLTRSIPRVSWSSGGSYDATAPAAVSFGNTAANVRVMLTSGHVNTRSVFSRPHDGSTGASLDGWGLFDDKQQWDTNAATITLADGTKYWWPVDYINPRQITQVAVRVTTGQPAKTGRLGIYDQDTSTGLAGNLISEFTSGGQISLASNNTFASVTPTALWVPPGNYWLCFQSDATSATIVTIRPYGNSRIATTASRDFMYFSKTGTYGALPSTGDNTSLTTVTLSGNVRPAAFYKV